MFREGQGNWGRVWRTAAEEDEGAEPAEEEAWGEYYHSTAPWYEGAARWGVAPSPRLAVTREKEKLLIAPGEV